MVRDDGFEKLSVEYRRLLSDSDEEHNQRQCAYEGDNEVEPAIGVHASHQRELNQIMGRSSAQPYRTG